MKTKWISKGLASLFACTLILGTASFASAKGPDKEHSTVSKTVVKTETKTVVKTDTDHKTVEKKTKTTVTKTTKKQETTKTTKKHQDEKQTKKTDKEKKEASEVGKNITKLLDSSEANINKITSVVNSYFKVDTSGTAQIDVSKATASYASSAFIGKLNAELNKLNAIDKQITEAQKKYKDVNSTDLTALTDKVKELQQQVLDEIKQVATLASQASAPKPGDGTTPPTDTTGTGTTTTTGTTDPGTTSGTDSSTTGTSDPTTTTGTTTDTTPSGTPVSGSTDPSAAGTPATGTPAA